VIELGLIRSTQSVDKGAIKQLKAHLAREKAAVKGSDVDARSFLLGDFRVCLAECLDNSLLADPLRDFTGRTTLIAMLYQSSYDAAQSCNEHVQIVAALEKNNLALAEKLMAAHIGTVKNALRLPAVADPLAQLRDALAPVARSPQAPATGPVKNTKPAQKTSPVKSAAKRRKTNAADDDSSTCLGVLL
jgi:hypothetical protein